MVVWRLYNERNDCADCSLEMTPTGAVSIRVRSAGRLTLTALAIDWARALQVIDESRDELLRQGWRQRLCLAEGRVVADAGPPTYDAPAMETTTWNR